MRAVLLVAIIETNADVSVQQAVEASFPREETLQIACMLAFVGGYLDAYTWIVHHVFANAQSANLVFLWVNLTTGEWLAATRYIPPLLAFVVGVILGCWLRWAIPERASAISTAMEIAFLLLVAMVHNRLPEVAGTLGLSLVAAFQMISFPRVEGWTYNSVMVTSNFRQTIEGLFTAFAASREPTRFHRPFLFGALCIAFGGGAAIGAMVTEWTRQFSLAIPVLLLVIVLLRCGFGPSAAEK